MQSSPTKSPRAFLWFISVWATIAVLPCLSWGALVWETKHIQLTTKLGDKMAIAVFPFQNTGPTPVTFLEVQPTCTCTTVELLKWNYAPGESGEIKAVFAFDDRVGPQEKFIKLRTDDPASPNLVLSFRLTIPELLTCTPRRLRWSKGTELTEQGTIVAIAEPYRLESIEISDPQPKEFSWRVEALEPGKSYRVFVRPIASADIMHRPVSLRCLARLQDGTIHPFQVVAFVE